MNMQSKLFDIGANLTHESFNEDLKEIIDESIESNINKICIISRTSYIDMRHSSSLCG